MDAKQQKSAQTEKTNITNIQITTTTTQTSNLAFNINIVAKVARRHIDTRPRASLALRLAVAGMIDAVAAALARGSCRFLCLQ
jgi:hypothetical protein